MNAAIVGIGPIEMVLLAAFVLVPVIVLLVIRAAGGTSESPPPYNYYQRPCPNCMRPIPADMIYCGYCGTPLNQAPAPGPMPQQPAGPPHHP